MKKLQKQKPWKPHRKPLVYIILLNWNNYELTEDCIKSLRKITYPNHRIIVVDNGSQHDVPRLKKLKKLYGKPRDVILIKNEKNLGFAEGNNVGIRHALKNNAEYVLLLNNDTVVDPRFLDILVDEAEKDPATGAVSPLIYYYDEQKNEQKKVWYAGASFNFWHGDSRHQHLNEIDHGQFRTVSNTTYGSGAALLVKQKVLREVGILDAYLFIYYEEADLCVRASRKGYAIKFVPQAKVWHKVSASTKKASPFMIRQNIRNRFIFMRKNSSWYHWPSFLIFYFVEVGMLIMYKLLRGDTAAAKAAVAGLLAGLKYRKKFSGKLPQNFLSKTTGQRPVACGF